jgi:hypothetical protein
MEMVVLKKIDGMGLIVIAAHLSITLVVVIGYIICLVKGIPAPQLETMVFMILAYWFGAMGSNLIRPNAQTQIHNAQEVRVNPPTEPPTDNQNNVQG